MRERSGSEGIAESPSTAQIQNQQNQHQQYSALPPTTPSTQDTATNKESSGNGTVDGEETGALSRTWAGGMGSFLFYFFS